MTLFHRLTRSFLALALLLWGASCSLKYGSKTGEDLSQETSHWEKKAQEYEDASIRAEAHLQLARLYLNYKNPKLDYRKALQEFEAHLSLLPEGTKEDEIQNWLRALRELQRSEKERREMRGKIEDLTRDNTEKSEVYQQMRSENRKLLENIQRLAAEITEKHSALEQQGKKNKKLQEKIEKLQDQNAGLKETIKKLKALDRQMEEKRKSIK